MMTANSRGNDGGNNSNNSSNNNGCDNSERNGHDNSEHNSHDNSHDPSYRVKFSTIAHPYTYVHDVLFNATKLTGGFF